MLVFADTEFTNFQNSKLISIGAVAENRQQFYAVDKNYQPSECSEFVIEQVIPLLSMHCDNCSSTIDDISVRFIDFINKLNCDHVDIVIDYPGDYVLIDQLIDHNVQLLKRTINYKMYSQVLFELGNADYHQAESTYQQIANRIEQSFDKDYIRHHALADARANYNGWVVGKQLFCNDVKEKHEYE